MVRPALSVVRVNMENYYIIVQPKLMCGVIEFHTTKASINEPIFVGHLT